MPLYLIGKLYECRCRLMLWEPLYTIKYSLQGIEFVLSSDMNLKSKTDIGGLLYALNYLVYQQQ